MIFIFDNFLCLGQIMKQAVEVIIEFFLGREIVLLVESKQTAKWKSSFYFKLWLNLPKSQLVVNFCTHAVAFSEFDSLLI